MLNLSGLIRQCAAISSIFTLLTVAACSNDSDSANASTSTSPTKTIQIAQAAAANQETTQPGAFKKVVSYSQSAGNSAGVRTDITLSSKGRYIATRSTEQIVVWDIQDNVEALKMDFVSSTENSVAFSPDEKFLAIATEQAISILNIQQGTEMTKLVHDQPVGDVAFSADGQKILSSAKVWALGKGAVSVWDSKTGRKISQLPYGLAYTSAISPDGKSIITGGIDQTIRVWNSQDGTEISQIDLNYKGSDNLPDRVGFVAGSPHIWAVTSGAIVGSWEIESGEEIMKVNETVLIPGISPNGQLAATLYFAPREPSIDYISLWNTRTGQEITRLEEDEDCRFSNNFSFSENGKYLVTTCFDGKPTNKDKLVVFDTESDTRTLTPVEVAEGISNSSFSLSPNGQQLAVWNINEDRTQSVVEVWDILDD